MAQVSVNLLKNRHILSERDYQREKQMLRSAVLALVVTVFVTIALSIWNFVLTGRLSTIEQSIAQASKQSQGLSEASVQQVYLKSRLNLITSFLDQRSVLNESLERIFSLSIPGATITSASFLTDTAISIQVSSRSVSVLNEALAYYQSDNLFFSQVVSRGIARTKDGVYELELELTIPKGGTTNG